MKKERNVVIISGRTGTGKTDLARKLYAAWYRRVIYDPQKEHSASGLTKFIHAFRGFHIAISDAEYASELAMLAGDCVLVLDDAYSVVRHPLGEKLKAVCNTGRHRSVSMIIVSQRVPDISPDLRAQVDAWIAFRSVLRSDNVTLERDWGLGGLDDLKSHEYAYQVYTDRPLRVEKLLTPRARTVAA